MVLSWSGFVSLLRPVGHLWISSNILVVITGREVAWAQAKADADADCPVIPKQPTVSPPAKNYLGLRLKNYSRALLPVILTWRTGAKSISCLSGNEVCGHHHHLGLSARISTQDGIKTSIQFRRLGWRPVSLVVMLLPRWVSASLLLLSNESAIGLGGPSCTVLSTLLFPNWVTVNVVGRMRAPKMSRPQFQNPWKCYHMAKGICRCVSRS